MIEADDFQVKAPLDLSRAPSIYARPATKQELKKQLNDTRESLADFQDRMYAHRKYAVLICIQGMDTAGKDSLIREVFKEFNVRGVNCYSYKVPSKREHRQDYLWRHYRDLPERGKFAVYNRTHYENVIVTRVHPEYLESEHIPSLYGPEGFRIPGEDFWDQRFEQINQFERHLIQNGTRIFKFFLNISREEQRHRLLRRLHKPEKNWKFSVADLEERKLWDRYQEVYQDAINRTSTVDSPWFIVPSDNKRWSRVIVAEILRQRLMEMTDVVYPEPAKEVQEQKEAIIHELENES